MLPAGRIATAKVQLSGGEVEIHGLTLAQSRIAGKLEDVERIVCAVHFATSTPKTEVEAWLDACPAGDATKLLNAIMDVSGLSEGAQFPQ